MSTNDFRTYLTALEQALKAGNATEHTHRPALKTLLEILGGQEIRATNEPKQIECGAPDYIVTRGLVPLGYVEAKDVGVDLDRAENSEQLKRYRQSLSNLILTDYFEFRWYVDGELRLAASLPKPGRDGRIRFNNDAASGVEQLLGQFIKADLPLKATPSDLATRMAGLARLIRDLIGQTFKAEEGAGELHAQLAAFRKVLLESLTSDQFADMYAQTLAYGLFAARCNTPGKGFTRQSAAANLPKTNPFLRKLFHSIAGPDLDERIAWAVDQLAELLARADMAAILEDFGRRTRKEDPVVHFYETFLAAYDPKMREARGVYYTPEPVVGYIVRSIDALLKRDFNLPEGLAHAGKVKITRPKMLGKSEEIFETHRLQILDPATGTGTFLYAVIAQIREHFTGNKGAWPSYVAEHLLPRLFGFELLMAPYAVAHMKLGLELEQFGYDFASNQRLGVFLTNSLEEAHEMTGLPMFTQWLAEEASAASNIKRDAPVMVVLGNPPYSGHSANTGQWIANLLRGEDNGRKTENYFECDGAPLGERNPKWLNDDYVKFMRFAQWRIEQTGHGILGFVTNHGYLDNPTFRGMRESLLRGFDEIYLLDLHGNSKKKEKAPDGGKDENVFDIQQGVAIGLFVRRKNVVRDEKHCARVFHLDLYGTRAVKYAGLSEHDINSTYWNELTPTSPNYYFVPENSTLRDEYEQGWKITDAMPVNVLGFQTHRDGFAIDFDFEKLQERIAVMRNTELTDAEYADKYGVKDNRDWHLRDARNAVRADKNWKEKLIRVAYRPFDDRWGYFSEVAMDYPRRELIQNVAGKANLCLAVSRQQATLGFRHVAVSRHPVNDCLVSTISREANQVFPLWLYPRASGDLLDAAPREKTPNLAPEFVAALAQTTGKPPSPEDTLAYIYAVLYAPGYRTRYGEFLKRDFPRVPLTSDRKLFNRLVKIGRELIALHTMESTLSRITGFPVAGTNEVVKIRFAPPAGKSKTGCIWINNAQYFDGVPPAVWEIHVGGYRVAEKWLKDRKGRLLNYDDLTHYQNVIAALTRTLELQTELDQAIANASGWPL
ncbi:MAG: DNA methyltransferase [Proteobacteria bacterium]|nr:DNA methyltransferase [Pseudomonadota bacterium]MCL2308307.1 DNA methyltransferase [Pseudomonadota bacterium]